MAGGEAEIVFGRVGGGILEGVLENGLGFSKFLDMNEGIGAVGDEGWVLRICGDQSDVKGVSLVELAVAGIEAGEQPGEVDVGGVGGMKLLGDGKGFVRLALVFIDTGQLRVEGGIVGVFEQGRGQNGFGFRGLLFADKDVREGGIGGGVLGIGLEKTAVGSFGRGQVIAGFGDLAGEEDVVWGFGGDFECGEEFGAGVGGAGGGIEAGEGSIGAGLKLGVGRVEGNGGGQFCSGVAEPAGAGEEEGEGEMGVEVGGVGGDGTTVGGLGGRGLVERVLGRGEVEEDVCVGRALLGEGGEEFEGGGIVLLVERGGGLSAEGILRRSLGLRGGVGGSWGKLRVSRGGQEQSCG